MTERMLLKDYKYCFDDFSGDSCQLERLCMCAQVYQIHEDNILRAAYGYEQHEWFDWEPLPEPPVSFESVKY